ncbi:MAG: STAS domain-containing protein [Paludibacteraceae bacterium]|nr:STAS domain-containing protein [Paludibacteraceae bacterium]
MQISVNDHVIALSGMLDTNSAPEFEQTVQQVLENDPAHWVLDLSDLNYTSSQGLRLFLTLQKGLTAKNASLTLRGIQPTVMEVFKMTGFTTLFTIE